ncbi:MAG: monovalent cation/H+ antiporter complex subunit F [Rhodanobacteraceae bacterium]
MSAWLIAALALLPALVAGVVCAGRGAVARRLVAIQFATSVSVLLLVVLDFAFDQPSSMDLALTLALLSLPGTLLLVLFQERWL